MTRDLEVQQALVERLRGNAALMALVTGVHSHKPQGSAFPYIVIGQGFVVEDDTQTWTGTRITVSIHTWSRYAGDAQVKGIQSALYSALHLQRLNLSAGDNWNLIFVSQEVIMDPDGETRHGVSRYLINTMR